MKNILLIFIFSSFNFLFSQNTVEKISPNPTKDKISVSFNYGQNVDFKVVIFDLIGNKIYENEFFNTNSESISFEYLNINYGLYIVHLYFNDQHKVKRIIYNQ